MADDHPTDDLACREPTVEDLRDLCRELNQRAAKYVVIGGFAIRAANYIRSTMDVDLVFATWRRTAGDVKCERFHAARRLSDRRP